MEPTALIEAAERDVAAAGRLLRAHRGLPGLSRACFDRVLALYGEHHGALARMERIARDVVRYGDDPALAYRALGIAERARGRWLRSAQAFVASGEVAASPRDRLSFKTGAIDSFARAGRVDEAIALAHELRDGLVALGEPGLAARAALNAGCALMTQDRYAETWTTLHGVAETLENHGFRSEAAATHLELSTSHLFGGDLDVAQREAQTAIRLAEAVGMDYTVEVAQGNLAYVEILRGDADLALQRLLPLRQAFAEAPVDLARTLEYMGDAHMRLNLWREAIDAYREALAIGAPIPHLRRAHLRLGIGQALLAVGQPIEAERDMAAASTAYRRLGNLAWYAAAEASRAEALRDPRRARRAVSVARRAKSPQHLAHALIVGATLTGDPGLLAEAERLVRRRGLRRLRWRVHALRAARAEAPFPHYRRMFAEILAERALTSSFASRAAFLRDKTAAIRTYLSLLLKEPSRRNVREAVSVIEGSRAVALLDEMLSAEAPDQSQEVWARLQELRRRLQSDPDETIPGQRRSVDVSPNLARVQRTWIEETHAIIERPSLRTRARSGTAICLETDELYALILGDRRFDLKLTVRDLERRLRWLQYDLLAPLAQPSASPKEAIDCLRELAEAILRPWLAGREAGICPDGRLWRVPWLACSDALGEAVDLEIRMHPGMKGSMRPWEGNLAIWLAEHPDLPNSGAEAAAILREHPNARVCRTSEEARVLLSEDRIAALHVIAHARMRWDNPMLSSIDFPDGPIHAAEIARAKVRIGLVTLAACDTGRLSNVNQDEPEGLVRAFLARGAGYVVGSAWTLDDAAACMMYPEIYRNLRAGHALWPSLRAAQAAVRAWNPHPYFWASPVVYGGYSA